MLPKTYRLSKDKDFERVFQRGRYYNQGFINLKTAKNNLEKSRFGFVIGLKISKKATVRNRIKRRLNEMIRLKLNQIKPGFDVVILTKPGIVNKNYQEIEQALGILLKKAKALMNS